MKNFSACPDKSSANTASGTSERLFIGIAPDAATQRFLGATCTHLASLRLPRNCRWIGDANRHLTLAFLGDTALDHMATIEQHLEEIAQSTPACTGHIVSTHPFPRDRAKMLAAELLPNPALATLHAHCRNLMTAIGKQPERKQFRPHFTLARSRSGFSRIPAVPADFICTLDNITLYHSLLAPGGSQYQPLLSLRLAG
ncbi:RNA 2',3'-cyclic phosphodiesterase [Microbulbifer sp. Q7]|uniref:RNA 2',3'-cyclic phosphodiesterase n=1 Tax=Microbulbifer sp. Q7 TaxID=1785091 RepID=UPI00082DE5B0|nr:RNA 2',3'-cyclic phosphodiesterase [Microbulbifer sp. Q7]